MSANSNYSSIIDRVRDIRSFYFFLKKKSDDYAFSAVCIKYSIYKNPALNLTENELEKAIIDGTNDGGADFLVLDPNNEEASDLIIGQSKYREKISTEETRNSINKMVDFYQKLRAGDFDGLRQDVVSRFQSLYSEIGDESKIIFSLYVSAPQNGIKIDSLKKIVSDRLGGEDKYELRVFFGPSIEEEISEAESRRPYVEKGSLCIDRKDNCLEYGDSAVIVNISASSLKKLYATYGNNLLSMNLRFFTKKQDIDSEIKNTIQNDRDTFWFKNNGITIVCEAFKIDGKELKLKNFSIINGGQTTYLVYKNGPKYEDEDFFICCKVITAIGDKQDQKEQFILEIAKATNSQKAIKDTDLKANSPEQLRFGRVLRQKGIFYKTKRGEVIPKEYRLDYLHTDYPATGKLYLAGVFQLPARSRNKPSSMKDVKFYNPIFVNSTDQKSSGLIKDLLYVDYFFRNSFIDDFDKEYEGDPIISFANNSRTICIAFIGLVSRVVQKNIDLAGFRKVINNVTSDSYYDNYIYPMLKNIENMDHFILPKYMEGDKTELDKVLKLFFNRLIKEGFKHFSSMKNNDPSLVESNFLKKDSSYYQILNASWYDLMDLINSNKHIFC